MVKCTVCGEVVSSKVIEKKEHTPAEKHVIVDASCSEFGSDSTVCSVCGETISVVFSAKLDHTPSETPEEVKGPSCSEEGLKVVKCNVCHEVVSSTPVACIPHTWGEWVPDAESKLKTRTCSECKATETSGSVALTAEVMEIAVSYDNMIGNVSSKVVKKTKYMADASVFSIKDGLLYDVKNFVTDGDVYTFEVKSHDEEKYHTYRIEFDEKGDPYSIIIDGVSVGNDYDANTDYYLWAFPSYMMSEPVLLKQYNEIINAEVTIDEKKYTLNFKAEYDKSKAYETRYMKITCGNATVLEYTLNLIGPKASYSSVSSLDYEEIIKYAKAVGVFTVDGESYDINDVNNALKGMIGFK